MLQIEIERLHRILDQRGIAYAPIEKQLSTDTIIPEIITEKHVLFFYSLFRRRKDVFSRRTIRKDGREAYYPVVCDNFWRYGLCPRRNGKKVQCGECQNRQWTPLTGRVIFNHLLGNREDGSDVIGLYPMFPDETCYFLVFDFDNHDADADGANSSTEWVEEVNAMREICRILDVPCLVERSRSGKGAHTGFYSTSQFPLKPPVVSVRPS